MNQSMKDQLALFVKNYQTIKKGFVWQHNLTKRLAAILYTLENKPIDCSAIEDGHALIKNNTSVFSSFRGNMVLCIATMLSLKGNYEQLLSDTITVYDLLKTAKFRASDYLTVAAYLIASNTERYNYQNVVDRAKAFYDGMKSRQWFHTSQDDYVFAVMLGLSEIDPITGTQRIEQLYQKLKPEFKFGAGGNSVQALSQILTLGSKSDEALDHLFSLRGLLRSHKVKLDKMYTLPVLGILSLLPVDSNTLTNDILEAQRYLRSQKGFGSFSITSQELLLFSSAIIASAYANERKDELMASITTSITNIIIVQQIAIIIMATSAASVGASAAAASS